MNRSGNKLKYQVELALKMINQIGKSKYSIRVIGEDPGIHSIKQMRHALSVNQNFANWLKNEKQIDDLFQLKRKYYREYIENMRSKEVSIGHLINIETNLRLLQKGMNRLSENKGMKPRDWCPNNRIIHASERIQSDNRAINSHEYQFYRSRLSNNAQISADLQIGFGLRLREVSKTKVAHIIFCNGELFWKADSDPLALNTAKGITKGGRPRITPCNPAFQERIMKLLRGQPQESYLSKLKYNSIKSAYNRAGIKGSHVFRHTYARNMLEHEFKKIKIETEGRDIVERMIHNRLEGYRKDYQIESDEKSLYREVNEVVDRVHGFLGHGISRSDLMRIYLKE